MRVNRTFGALTGHDRTRMLAGERFPALLTIGGQMLYETHCMPVLLAGGAVDQLALDVRCADGSILPVLFAAKVRGRDAGGGPAILRVTLVDVSHRRRFESDLVARNAELARSNEEYDTFAYAAAHDLQAPLRGIRQNTEFFLEDTEGQLPAEAREQLDTAVRLAGHMQQMLDDLLVYAQAGRGVPAPRPLSIRETVAEVVELLGERLAGAEMRAVDASITADHGALQQVLLNLVSNAVKYSEGPAEITVGVCGLDEAAAHSTLPSSLADRAPDTCVLTVSDRGVGIERDHHDRIFVLFRQLDPNADGSGTGLALCRLICRRHGGDIWLTSQPGAGTTFYVVL